MNTTNQDKKDKIFFIWAMALSLIVFVAVIVLNRKIIPRPECPDWIYLLPLLNAMLNGTNTILLVLSGYYIRKKQIDIHKWLNITAFTLSVLFLLSYITYHWIADETSFPNDNPNRNIYLILLISHILLAAVVLPLILFAFYYGLNNKIEKHRRIVRWAYPIWLYVTSTGVIIYLMISPYYKMI